MDSTLAAAPSIPFTDEEVPRGFRFAAVHAGLKASGNSDLACVVADEPAAAAAMFTGNRVVAAPIAVGRDHLERSGNRIRAVVVNAGNANCATGEAGIRGAEAVCVKTAELFSCPPSNVIPSSTGIIGVPFPQEKVIAALPALAAQLGSSAQHLEQMARAIMTTDTVPKTAFACCQVAGREIRIAGIAKGAGMMQPRLVDSPPHATMLVYLFTDAALDPSVAQQFLSPAVHETFNRISIDGDTSTNDTVLLLASGAGGIRIGAPPAALSSADGDETPEAEFFSALRSVCLSLARQIVSDGEGITHVVELQITGAFDDGEALTIARSIANSPLVKTAWAGCDPNWGRILAAAGYSGALIDPAVVDIHLGQLELCRGGAVSPAFDEQAAHRALLEREVSIRVRVGSGPGECRFWTTDLTAEYVHINADYST